MINYYDNILNTSLYKFDSEIITLPSLNITDIAEHLRLDDNNFQSGSTYFKTLINAAILWCENYLNDDIAIKANTLSIDSYSNQHLYLKPTKNFISVSSITYSNVNSEVITLTSEEYNILHNGNRVIIEFTKDFVKTDLIVIYKTGISDLLTNDKYELLKFGIYTKIMDLFDTERTSYTIAQVKNNDTVKLLLAKYKNIYFI